MDNLIISIFGAALFFSAAVYFYFLWRKVVDFSKYHPSLQAKQKVTFITGVTALVATVGFIGSILKIFVPDLL